MESTKYFWLFNEINSSINEVENLNGEWWSENVNYISNNMQGNRVLAVKLTSDECLRFLWTKEGEGWTKEVLQLNMDKGERLFQKLDLETGSGPCLAGCFVCLKKGFSEDSTEQTRFEENKSSIEVSKKGYKKALKAKEVYWNPKTSSIEITKKAFEVMFEAPGCDKLVSVHNKSILDVIKSEGNKEHIVNVYKDIDTKILGHSFYYAYDNNRHIFFDTNDELIKSTNDTLYALAFMVKKLFKLKNTNGYTISVGGDLKQQQIVTFESIQN